MKFLEMEIFKRLEEREQRLNEGAVTGNRKESSCLGVDCIGGKAREACGSHSPYRPELGGQQVNCQM